MPSRTFCCVKLEKKNDTLSVGFSFQWHRNRDPCDNRREWGIKLLILHGWFYILRLYMIDVPLLASSKNTVPLSGLTPCPQCYIPAGCRQVSLLFAAYSLRPFHYTIVMILCSAFLLWGGGATPQPQFPSRALSLVRTGLHPLPLFP